MRLCIDDKNDPGYLALLSLGGPHPGIRVFLDDIEQHHCSMADSDQGVIRRCIANAEGELFTIDGEFITEEVRGTVRIEIVHCDH